MVATGKLQAKKQGAAGQSKDKGSFTEQGGQVHNKQHDVLRFTCLADFCFV